jgi:hypothetical protein
LVPSVFFHPLVNELQAFATGGFGDGDRLSGIVEVSQHRGASGRILDGLEIAQHFGFEIICGCGVELDRTEHFNARRMRARRIADDDGEAPTRTLSGGPTASMMVSPCRQAGSPLTSTVGEPSMMTPGPCGGSGKGVVQA